MSTARIPSPAPLVWQRDVPLVSNPVMLRSLVILCVVTAAIMIGLVGGIVLLTEGLEPALSIAALALATAGGLFLLCLLIMLIVFGNRMRMEFSIDERGVAARVIDKRSKVANRLALVVGALARRPGVAGAGMLAISEEERSTVWSGIAEAKYDPRHFTITLRNAWRPILHVFCSPETYEEAAARVAGHLAKSRQPARRRRNPLWPVLGLTLLVVVAILPLFGMPYPFKLDLFAAIFTLCFALATLWLVPLMGWPTLAGVLWLAAGLLVQGLETRTNQFSGRVYSGFESLDASEWVGFGITCLGLAVIAGISIAALRGRVPSLLMSDMLEMAGEDKK